MAIVVSPSEHTDYRPDAEIVERKGIGHPDTICDALAEQFSVSLSRFYLERFGTILHHNVDKALLRGGTARARFGGGEVLEPIDVYLAGRAVTSVGDVEIPVADIAAATVRDWFRSHLRALDPDRHVRVHCLVRPGSFELEDLFSRQKNDGVPLANDTSFGVGYAPLSRLEQLVLDVEGELNSDAFLSTHPAHGEDVKLMAVRSGGGVSVTIARAFIAPHVASLAQYRAEKERLREHVAEALRSVCDAPDVHVNAADAPDGSALYLTVTGTSAESGDDGEVGRGNRGNGLITPCRPMSLEALAGKNAVSHVGKLYNLAARRIAEDVVAKVNGASRAECFLVSRIGAPINEPALALVRLGTRGPSAESLTAPVAEIVRAHLDDIRNLWRDVIGQRA
jgi:S-adenosylmethionine synthetase